MCSQSDSCRPPAGLRGQAGLPGPRLHPSSPPRGPRERVHSCTLPRGPATSTSPFQTHPLACLATILPHVYLEPSFPSSSTPGPLSLLSILQGPPPELPQASLNRCCIHSWGSFDCEGGGLACRIGGGGEGGEALTQVTVGNKNVFLSPLRVPGHV